MAPHCEQLLHLSRLLRSPIRLDNAVLRGGVCRLRTALSILFLGTQVACETGERPIAKEAHHVESRRQESHTVVFRDSDGRTLTFDQLEGATGTYRYEIIGSSGVTPEAKARHEEARTFGARGDYKTAIELLGMAAALAPQWPYPIYDRAYTHLLKGDSDAAFEDYKKTIELAPRGFFTAITALDTLRRERSDALPKGTYRAYLSLEWIDDAAQKNEMARALTERLPQFAPGWKDLAVLTDDDAERLAIIEKGLAAEPDGETKGILQVNKALILDAQGRRADAVELLGQLVLAPTSTVGTEHIAKVALASLVKP